MIAFVSCNTDNNSFHLDTFKTLPTDLDSCVCYYALSEKDYSKSKFIFATRFDNTAYIYIDNTFIKLTLLKQVVGEHEYVYTNEKYESTIKTDVTETHPQFLLKGTLLIKQKGLNPTSRQIKGKCKC